MSDPGRDRTSEPLVNIIAVGTLRRPKVRAVERAFARLKVHHREFLPGELRIEPRSVPSGVSSTPTTVKECVEGARLRAGAARSLVTTEVGSCSLGIGLEGGIVALGQAHFLESWACVSDREGYELGSSGRIPLPEALARAVLEEGKDLGTAADDFFDRQDVASHEGTFGVLSADSVTREDAFLRSLLHALAPFYNEEVYQRGE